MAFYPNEGQPLRTHGDSVGSAPEKGLCPRNVQGEIFMVLNGAGLAECTLKEHVQHAGQRMPESRAVRPAECL